MIGDQIKRIRKSKNLTQEQLGDLVGISGVAIMRYEKGQREPNKETIQKIADALETTPTQLMDWDDIQREIQESDIYDEFLKALGYEIAYKKTGQSESGYYEDHKDDEGTIIGKSFIPDEEYFSVFIIKDNLTTEFTDEEFKTFKDTVQKSIEFELFRQNQKNKKKDPWCSEHQGS